MLWSGILAMLLQIAVGDPCSDIRAHEQWKPEFDDMSNLISFEPEELPVTQHLKPRDWIDGPRADFMTITCDPGDMGGGYSQPSCRSHRLGDDALR